MLSCPAYSWDLLCEVSWHGGGVAGQRIVEVCYSGYAARYINRTFREWSRCWRRPETKRGAQAQLGIYNHPDSRRWQLRITDQARAIPSSRVCGPTGHSPSLERGDCGCETVPATVSGGRKVGAYRWILQQDCGINRGGTVCWAGFFGHGGKACTIKGLTQRTRHDCSVCHGICAHIYWGGFTTHGDRDARTRERGDIAEGAEEAG